MWTVSVGLDVCPLTCCFVLSVSLCHADYTFREASIRLYSMSVQRYTLPYTTLDLKLVCNGSKTEEEIKKERKVNSLQNE